MTGPLRRGRRRLRQRPLAGYSLVELLISSVLFTVVGIGSVSLLGLTLRQQVRTEGVQAEQFAISLDEANLRRMNDRFTCQSGTCLIKTGTAPNQNEYYPAGGSAAETMVLGLCRPTSSSATSLADPLVALINTTAPTSQMTGLGISRQAVREAEAVGQPFAHRYTVTWRSQANTILRQITMAPTAAGWCP